MKYIIFTLLPFILIASACQHAKIDEYSLKQAKNSAKFWLMLVDGDLYSQSYNEASVLLQTKIDEKEWKKRLVKTRFPLGKVKKREYISVKKKRKLPDAPENIYIIIKYKTIFENKDAATETIIVTKDPDEVWRVVSYSIK